MLATLLVLFLLQFKMFIDLLKIWKDFDKFWKKFNCKFQISNILDFVRKFWKSFENL